MFRLENWKRIALTDAEELLPALTGSEVNSCECAFGNLYVWGYPCGTRWQKYHDHFYFHLPCMDVMFFSGYPEPAELAEISKIMTSAGRSGKFFQITQKYLETYPAEEIGKYFTVEQLPDASAEYIYEVESLVELKGEKLRKKRNLIKQFLKEYPDAAVMDITPGKILDDCLALSAEWRKNLPDSLSLQMEAAAMAHLPDGFTEMGYEGIAAYIHGGETLAAYAVYARINHEMYTESFEKSRSDCKGAAQFINHEMAKRLTGKCRYINREQDLGSEGLRQAKLSYAPVFLLKNYQFLPK